MMILPNVLRVNINVVVVEELTIDSGRCDGAMTFATNHDDGKECNDDERVDGAKVEEGVGAVALVDDAAEQRAKRRTKSVVETREETLHR